MHTFLKCHNIKISSENTILSITSRLHLTRDALTMNLRTKLAISVLPPPRLSASTISEARKSNQSELDFLVPTADRNLKEQRILNYLLHRQSL